MNDQQNAHAAIDGLYDEHWHVNTGGKTIHAKRMPGRFRTLKWLAAATWLAFFIGPYLRWNGRQAILFDIPNRKFQIFDVTILPQDVWMLSLTLLFFAILLAVVTSVAGRVFCGYFCFQTVFTDLFTLIEEKLEGSAQQRRKLEEAPWSGKKLAIKSTKHAIYVLIGVLTGITFTLWFGDAFELWHDYLTFSASTVAWGSVAVFTFFTYLFGAHMREQVCFWLCPYARIQGVMYDNETILPTYDFHRGEQRGKLKKGQVAEGNGHCIDCGQCVAVCPTGIDIREGQQEGCITCGLCIDACDAVMDKVHLPRGLVRYASQDELDGKPTLKLWQRPRVLVYFAIISAAAIGILYGLTHLGSLELRVLHERQPLFVLQSDGSIQNKYILKILNKTDAEAYVTVTAEGPEPLTLIGVGEPLLTRPGDVATHIVYAKVPRKLLTAEVEPIIFHITAIGESEVVSSYESMFMGPRR